MSSFPRGDNEQMQAAALASRLLDVPNCDPDDDLRVLARQLLRLRESLEKAREYIEQFHKLDGASRDDVLFVNKLRASLGLHPVGDNYADPRSWKL